MALLHVIGRSISTWVITLPSVCCDKEDNSIPLGADDDDDLINFVSIFCATNQCNRYTMSGQNPQVTMHFMPALPQGVHLSPHYEATVSIVNCPC